MDFSLATALQIIISLGLLNVWILRAGSSTAYRGGESQDLKSEFTAYGLPTWAFYAVGALKLSLAVVFIVGVWVPSVVLPASILLFALMAGALVMHLRVQDPIRRSLPALAMLAMAAVLFVN